jgi:hypothetical protein
MRFAPGTRRIRSATAPECLSFSGSLGSVGAEHQLSSFNYELLG